MLKQLDETIGDILQDTGVGKVFLYRIPFFQELRPNSDNCGLIKLKSNGNNGNVQQWKQSNEEKDQSGKDSLPAISLIKN